MPLDPLADLSDQLDPLQPLEADDAGEALYVDWQAELDPDDNIKVQLTNAFARRRATTKWRLLTGHRGVGKTTELKRVERRLKDRRVFALYLDVDDWLDVEDVEPEDVIMQIARLIVTELEHAGIKFSSQRFEEVARRWDELVPSQAGFAGFSLTRKAQPGDDDRRQFRAALRGLVPSTIDLINNEVLKRADAELQRLGYRDLVVLVDSLDKIESVERATKVFVEGSGALRALDCDVLYTVPIQLAYSTARNELAGLYDDVNLLPVVPVATRDGSPDDRGVAALREVVRRRAQRAALSLEQIFEPIELLDEIVLASGGHVRQLFQLLNRMLDRTDQLPLRRPLVERSLQRAAQDMSLGLRTSAERELLARVHERRADIGEGSDVWNALLRARFILGYRDHDGYWYDRNPVLAWNQP